MKRYLCMLLLGTILAGTGVVPMPAGAGMAWAEEAQAGQEDMDAGPEIFAAIQSIQYSDLPGLVKAYSPRVKMERIQYERNLGIYEAAREEIMETRRLLREEAKDMEDNGDPEGAESYRSQAKVLEDSAKRLDESIRMSKGSSGTMSIREMEDTMIWAAQSLMGTYHSLKAEQESAAAIAALLQGRYEKAGRQAALGAVPQSDADEAEKAAQAAHNQAQGLGEEMERIRRELLMVTGLPVEAGITIGPMPKPDPGRVDSMSLEVDKWRAMGNNYGLRKQRSGSSGSTNKEVHAYQRAVVEGEENLYALVDTLYQDVLASRSAWQAACTIQAAEEAKWNAASHKMELGMLSRQEYLEARAAYLDKAAVKARADVNFQQAMDTYDWAVKGLTQG